ncbi:progesterone receptor [Tachyglossus aculeatus]|uniref:progesterone receptor n=1 Tax=Tachyglossus aculeatus TaxID=9261 RepID=UPI0018F6D7F6|nr:progesterone receptor [Tachyglossus aculeatus]
MWVTVGKEQGYTLGYSQAKLLTVPIFTLLTTDHMLTLFVLSEAPSSSSGRPLLPHLFRPFLKSKCRVFFGCPPGVPGPGPPRLRRPPAPSLRAWRSCCSPGPAARTGPPRPPRTGRPARWTACWTPCWTPPPPGGCRGPRWAAAGTGRRGGVQKAAPGEAPSPPAAALLDLVPLLPLEPALLAARTRRLLQGGEEAEGGPLGPPDPKDRPCLPLEHFPPPALKIKEEEEEEAGEAAATSTATGPCPSLPPRPPLLPAGCPDYLPPPPASPGAAPSSSSSLEGVLSKAEAPPGPFGPPLCLLPRDGLPSTSASASPGLYGLPPLAYQPQVYQPYLNYLRPDTEASQSPQYSFESLPQKICLICGDEASGCHYGVLTCGSCKVFFKRAMEGQHNYLCAGRNDCIVDKIRRKNCPACRLRKCCQAGMVLGGRKFKKFNKVRVVRAIDAVALPQPMGLQNESQGLAQRLSFSPCQEMQFVPQLINLLMSIEPEVIYAGYDNTKPETPSTLLTSLNQLGERQLLSVVKWSKSLPGFRNLHIDDQITLIQYSWMSLMVFGLGWRSYKHVSGQMLYFAPDLILNEQRMKESSFYSICLTMWQIPQEFVKLQVTQEEFLCMKALLLLNTIPLEGLRSQAQFEEMRASYIRELVKSIGLRQKGVVSSSQRFYQLTKLLDSLHDLVKQLHLYCLNTFIQSRALCVEFPEMMTEVIAAQLPKILAGMVKPLLFHKK